MSGPQIEKVVTGEVKTERSFLSVRGMKGRLPWWDAQTVARYVGVEVLLPALREPTCRRFTTKGIERMVYGESASPRRVPDYRPSNNVQFTYKPRIHSDPRYGGRNKSRDQPTYSTNRSSLN